MTDEERDALLKIVGSAKLPAVDLSMATVNPTFERVWDEALKRWTVAQEGSTLRTHGIDIIRVTGDGEIERIDPDDFFPAPSSGERVK